ncbi:MAG: YeeE/YedE thiosulfate transporter family protein [Candidatus Kapabacteria bacterium]|jgi:uncharacterized membrane protein YedE/YeeE|nr:YeeE/YedE thiosulfate transporter family protein [Candidatus Kapabacteria bacterium]
MSSGHNHKTFNPKPYWNPYVAGVGLGLVLLAAFVIMGRGLGASGALSTIAAVGIEKIAPAHAQANEFYMGYVGDGSYNPLKDWLIFEVLGVLVGGFLSGIFAGRVRKTIDKGPRVSNKGRIFMAVFGGVLMGFGAKLARGCTSGQALTGGSMLNLGSWAFMLSVFAGAYLLAYFVRRQWT